MWSNYFIANRVDPMWRSVPYGVPIWNHQYYCLDASGEPVHIGVPGDLCIGGIGVARGYIGRPDLTAERFVDNKYHKGTMYKAGDLVRFMPLSPWGVVDSEICAQNLVLEFLGRLDFQVKINGYRIELGEIERACEGVPGIEAAVVLAVRSMGSREACGAPRCVDFPEFDWTVA